MLLVFGAAMLAGGIRYPEQRFNPLGARSQATMLLLAAVALIIGWLRHSDGRFAPVIRH